MLENCFLVSFLIFFYKFKSHKSIKVSFAIESLLLIMSIEKQTVNSKRIMLMNGDKGHGRQPRMVLQQGW